MPGVAPLDDYSQRQSERRQKPAATEASEACHLRSPCALNRLPRRDCFLKFRRRNSIHPTPLRQTIAACRRAGTKTCGMTNLSASGSKAAPDDEGEERLGRSRRQGPVACWDCLSSGEDRLVGVAARARPYRGVSRSSEISGRTPAKRIGAQAGIRPAPYCGTYPRQAGWLSAGAY